MSCVRSAGRRPDRRDTCVEWWSDTHLPPRPLHARLPPGEAQVLARWAHAPLPLRRSLHRLNGKPAQRYQLMNTSVYFSLILQTTKPLYLEQQFLICPVVKKVKQKKKQNITDGAVHRTYHENTNSLSSRTLFKHDFYLTGWLVAQILLKIYTIFALSAHDWYHTPKDQQTAQTNSCYLSAINN